MDCKSTRLKYRDTNSFQGIILDYLDGVADLKPFYAGAPDLEGIKHSIAARKNFNTNRDVLVQQLRKQYETVSVHEKVRKNIDALTSGETFTITTAHQNNIFTGPLYFIYKIIHAIKFADELNKSITGQHFVPVYYIGSEDADLAELNHIYLDGEKLVWATDQQGAVGRMKVDRLLLQMIHRIEGQLGVLPNGQSILTLVKEYYQEGMSIQDATFGLVNALFGRFGLIVLLPDNAVLKSQAGSLFEDDLLHQTASAIVEKTAARLDAAGYKVQANPREINLFYLLEDSRERIELENDVWKVLNTDIAFSKPELLNELKEHPERFSPNVILRGLYQETILPNIAFIGGGGETAYWLQLKGLFEHYKVPFPVLILRNSFIIIDTKTQKLIERLGFGLEEIFQSASALHNKIVHRDSENKLKLNGTLTAAEQIYDTIRQQAGSIDSTLEKHVESLKLKTIYRLQELEKKMLRAEKRKFVEQEAKIKTLRDKLFPKNGLQERIDNFMPYYAQYGEGFIDCIYNSSLTLEQEFVVLEVTG